MNQMHVREKGTPSIVAKPHVRQSLKRCWQEPQMQLKHLKNIVEHKDVFVTRRRLLTDEVASMSSNCWIAGVIDCWCRCSFYFARLLLIQVASEIVGVVYLMNDESGDVRG